MPDIASNINHVQQRIDSAASAVGRDPATIRLLAVSKTHCATTIEHAWRAGLRHFGENYLQEALAKMAQLIHLDIEWHFIGPLQSNKTRAIAERFAWVHSIDRLKIAERLSAQRGADSLPLQVCLQVNVDAEDSKAGVAPTEVAELALAISQLPRLQLRGLMCIPRPAEDETQLGRSFARLRNLLQTIQSTHPELSAMDTLSMGMSGDLETAIAAGSTLVRVGSDIFGPRGH